MRKTKIIEEPKKVEAIKKTEKPTKQPATPEVSKGIFCKFCNRSHEKSFDGPGINHDGFGTGGKAEIIFNKLCDQPKLSLFVPFETGEKLGAVVSPMINGLRINILKGQYVEVPRQIAGIEMESLNQTAMVSENLKTVNPFTGKSVNARLDLQDEAAQNRLNR